MQQLTESFGRSELDSHADMCGVTELARILEYTNQVVEVTGFVNSFQPLKDKPIVKAAVAYDHPETGEIIVLILNQALYFGNQVNKFLLNPNQLRAYWNIVNNVPKQFGGSSHSSTTSKGDLNIPLKMRGTISYFPVRTPSLHEIENCTNINLSSESEWDPYSTIYQENEGDDTHFNRSIHELTSEHMDLSDDVALKVFQISKLKTESKQNFKSDEQLAHTWVIPTLIASDTLKATTQEFIRSSIHPVERRFCTKNAMLRYNRLSCQMYSDTFFTNCASPTGNKCAQLFVTDFGYLKFTAMKNKSEAGYASQELIREVGIPPRIHTDGAKVLTNGKWKEVCRDSNIIMSQTEKDSP